MTSDKERGRDVEPAAEVRGSAEAGRRRPRPRVVSEALVAAIPAPEETASAEGGAGEEAEAGSA